MPRPVLDYTLYLVTDRKLAGERDLRQVVAEAVIGGVTVCQIREKELDSGPFLNSALELKKLLDEHGVPLIINDRVDIALACGAAGVHVGQSDLPCKKARELVGNRMVVGVSVETVEQAIKAQADGADYLGISPVYNTPTKTDTVAATGLEGLRAIRRATELPLVGIGGLSKKNAAEVIRAGADGIAVVSAIVAAADPRRAATRIMEAIREGRR